MYYMLASCLRIISTQQQKIKLCCLEIRKTITRQRTTKPNITQNQPRTPTTDEPTTHKTILCHTQPTTTTHLYPLPLNHSTIYILYIIPAGIIYFTHHYSPLVYRRSMIADTIIIYVYDIVPS